MCPFCFQRAPARLFDSSQNFKYIIMKNLLMWFLFIASLVFGSMYSEADEPFAKTMSITCMGSFFLIWKFLPSDTEPINQ